MPLKDKLTEPTLPTAPVTSASNMVTEVEAVFSTPINNLTSPTSGAPATATMQSPRVTITRRKRNRSVIPTFGVTTVATESIELNGGQLTSSTAPLSFLTSQRTLMSPAMPNAYSSTVSMLPPLISQVPRSSSLRDQVDQSISKAKSLDKRAVIHQMMVLAMQELDVKRMH